MIIVDKDGNEIQEERQTQYARYSVRKHDGKPVSVDYFDLDCDRILIQRVDSTALISIERLGEQVAIMSFDAGGSAFEKLPDICAVERFEIYDGEK